MASKVKKSNYKGKMVSIGIDMHKIAGNLPSLHSSRSGRRPKGRIKIRRSPKVALNIWRFHQILRFGRSFQTCLHFSPIDIIICF